MKRNRETEKKITRYPLTRQVGRPMEQNGCFVDQRCKGVSVDTPRWGPIEKISNGRISLQIMRKDTLKVGQR